MNTLSKVAWYSNDYAKWLETTSGEVKETVVSTSKLIPLFKYLPLMVNVESIRGGTKASVWMISKMVKGSGWCSASSLPILGTDELKGNVLDLDKQDTMEKLVKSMVNGVFYSDENTYAFIPKEYPSIKLSSSDDVDGTLTILCKMVKSNIIKLK